MGINAAGEIPDVSAMAPVRTPTVPPAAPASRHPALSLQRPTT